MQSSGGSLGHLLPPVKLSDTIKTDPWQGGNHKINLLLGEERQSLVSEQKALLWCLHCLWLQNDRQESYCHHRRLPSLVPQRKEHVNKGWYFSCRNVLRSKCDLKKKNPRFCFCGSQGSCIFGHSFVLIYGGLSKLTWCGADWLLQFDISYRPRMRWIAGSLWVRRQKSLCHSRVLGAWGSKQRVCLACLMGKNKRFPSAVAANPPTSGCCDACGPCNLTFAERY